MSIDSSIVVDLGSSTVKAGLVFGFPSDDEPRVVTPAAVRLFPEGSDAQAALKSGQQGTLIHPVQQGVIKDWDSLETLLHYVIYDELGWVEGEEGNLLLADPVLTSRTDRERMAALMFETFNVAGYFVSDQAVLSLYAVGKLNGTVVDIGDTTIDVTPVLEGLTLPSACCRRPFGGAQLTRRMGEILAARGVALPGGQAAALAAMEAIKIKSLRAALGDAGGGGGAGAGAAAGEEPRAPEEQAATHVLPDGQVITIEPRDGEALLESLLHPSLLGLRLPPLAEAVVTAGASHPEKEARKALMESIFVCGGGGAERGVAQRLLAEVRAVVTPPPLQPGLCSVPEYMPEHTAKVAAWMGGATLAKVVFAPQGVCITKADYDENGPHIVNKRCS